MEKVDILVFLIVMDILCAFKQNRFYVRHCIIHKNVVLAALLLVFGMVGAFAQIPAAYCGTVVRTGTANRVLTSPTYGAGDLAAVQSRAVFFELADTLDAETEAKEIAIFKWTGVSDSSWKNPANWSHSGHAVMNLPGFRDAVVIPSGKPVPVLDTEALIAHLTVESGASICGAVGENSLTVNKTVKLAGSIGTADAPLGSFGVKGTTEVIQAVKIITSGSQTYTGAVLLGADLSVSTGDDAGNISFDSAIDSAAVAAKNLTLSAGTGTITLGGAVGKNKPIGTITIDSLGAFEQPSSATIMLSGSWNNRSGMPLRVSSLEFTGSGISPDVSIISGENTFSVFVCKSEGKTIRFPTDLTTVHKFAVSGGARKEITIESAGSSWRILFTGTTGTYAAPNMKNVIVKNSRISEPGGNSIYVAAFSTAIKACIGNSTAGSVRWIFDAIGEVLFWNGSIDNEWGTAGNWNLKRIPVQRDTVVIPYVFSMDGVYRQLNITKTEKVANAIIIGNVGGAGSLEISNDLLINGWTYGYINYSSYISIAPKLTVTGKTTINCYHEVYLSGSAESMFTGGISVERTNKLVINCKDALFTNIFAGLVYIYNSGVLMLGDTGSGAAPTFVAQYGLIQGGVGKNSSVKLNANIHSNFKSSQPFDGTISFASPITLINDITIKSASGVISLPGAIDGDHSLTLAAKNDYISISGAMGNTVPFAHLSATAPYIYLNGGKIATTGKQTYYGAVQVGTKPAMLSTVDNTVYFTGAVTLYTDLSVNTGTGSGNITFKSTVNGTATNSQKLSLTAGTGNIIFGGAVGDTTALNTLTINSAGLDAITGGIQFASDVTANALTFAASPEVKSVFISGASTFSIGGAAVSSINFPANLFIAAGTGNAVSFKNDLRVANSIALFSGNVSLGGDLTADGDIVLLKGNASTMFKGGSLEGLFGYNAQNMASYAAARGTLTASVSIPVFPDTLPDGSAINHTGTAVYSGSVTIPAGKTVSAGQNFYANGVDLIASASWKLKLKDNESALNAFAEAYNLSITNCTVECLTTTGSAWLSAAENCTDGGGNTATLKTGCALTRPKLLVNDDSKATGAPFSGTYTIYDDVIRVEFVDSITGAEIKIENSNNEISAALANIKFNGNATVFTASFTDPDCTISTDGAGDLSVFYLKTNGTAGQRWNTDATATDEGDINSTDRGRTDQLPEHRTVLPTIDIPTALATLYQTLRDEHKNRIATVTFTDTADRCRPVVVEVRTGQEVHKPFASQEKYDAHNFIEIRYSEPVTIPKFSDPPRQNEYVKSQSTPSATVAGGAIAQNGAGLDISGFMNLANGILDTGAAGVKDNEVHALYRNFTFDGTSAALPQSHRVRISIAGWTSLSATGVTGYEYPGYIDNAVTPSGLVTVVTNRHITDNSAAYNVNSVKGNAVEPTVNDDPAYGNNSYPKAAITVDVAVTLPPTKQDLYGTWDVLPPVVSRFNWNEENDGYEIVGNSDSSGYVGNFEFHFFDNTPDYSNTTPPGGETWQYSRGWGTSSDNPIRPDTVGGSRPEYVQTPTHPKTQGGLRATTITVDIVKNAFSLHLADQRNNIGFDNFEPFVTLNNFFGDGTKPLPLVDDTLYLSLTPELNNLRSRETYDVIYDSSKGFITDLAGNRLKSALWQTVDRTPPKISMTVTPYDDMRLFVFFNKKIELEPLPAAQNAVLSNIHQEFLFFNKFSDPSLDPDESLVIPDLRATKAELVFQTADATGLILTLSRKVTYTELSTAFISLKKHAGLQDIIGPILAASNIIDKNYNCMNWNDRIPITYFGVNTIKPLYATDGMVQTGCDTKEGTTVVIRGDFDGSGQLYYDREISMQVRLADGVTPQTVPEVFIDAKPNPNSVSLTFNKNFGKNLSFWLPNLPHFPYLFISPEMNTHAVQLPTGTGSGQLYTFKIPVNTPEREPTDTLQFIFKHGEIMTPDRITGQLTVTTPFYHIRLNNAQDPSELSLFTFKVLSMLRQRGGSTILNNVIQAGSEEAVLEVIMPKQGNLTVSVMTLDGNVVKHLHRGTAAAGTHYLRWKGTNASGRAVARGMYFVRIIGPNTDETRKIMVVKD